jgi:prevent-host-death family protein
MRSIGIREFKNRFEKVIQEVEAGREEIAVTRRGKEILHLVPVRRRMTPVEIAEWNARMDALAKKISEKWPTGLSAAEAISQDRSRLDN